MALRTPQQAPRQTLAACLPADLVEGATDVAPAAVAGLVEGAPDAEVAPAPDDALANGLRGERRGLAESTGAPRLEGLTLQPGMRLYHGTLEDLEGALQPSGYDGCLWLADMATVARCYIPASPGRVWTSLERLTEAPGESDLVAHYQAQLGISFRDLVYGKRIRPESYRHPEVFEGLMEGVPRPVKEDFGKDDDYYRALFGWQDEQKRRFQALVAGKLRDLGYDIPEAFDPGATLELKTSMRDGTDRILRNEHQPGTLLEFTPGRPLVIYDLTEGGTREGDLTDLDYHKHRTFRRCEAMGYDGVKINDFAQSRSHGNMGHTSIGIFRHAIPSLVEVARTVSRHPVDAHEECMAELAAERNARQHDDPLKGA